MKKGISKRLFLLLASVAAVIVIFFAVGITASAASYPSIKLENTPRISQRPNTGDCAIASISTVEAYMHGLPSGDYNSKAYQSVYAANGYSIGANWSALGYTPVNSFNMQTVYDQLATGYPVIVHRTAASASHYSVVYGYTGSSSKLQLSGFLLIEVDDWYNGRDSERQTLDEWTEGFTLDRMIIRQNGLAITPTSLKINGNHPPKNYTKGAAFTPYGMVLSNKNITSVKVSVKNSAGKDVYSYSAAPNSTQFSLSKASSSLQFSKLGNGSYTYEVYAKDSSGATKTYKYSFGIGTSADQPIDKPVDKPVEKPVSYKAVVKASPSLNMRAGAGSDYNVIASIPDGTIINITAECNGWAKTSYNGKTGWVSLGYITKYTEPPKPVKPVEPVTQAKTVFGLVASESAMKSTASFFGQTTARIPKNTMVTILDKSSLWLKVSYAGKEGWVLSVNVVEGVGDIDGNGVVNSSDALLVLGFTTGTKATDLQRQLADVNGDGKINSIDALVILQAAVALKDK